MELLQQLLIVVGLSLGLFLLGFWIWMLVECVKREPREGNDRLIWIIIIVATKGLGAVLYYFLRRPQRMRLHES